MCGALKAGSRCNHVKSSSGHVHESFTRSPTVFKSLLADAVHFSSEKIRTGEYQAAESRQARHNLWPLKHRFVTEATQIPSLLSFCVHPTLVGVYLKLLQIGEVLLSLRSCCGLSGICPHEVIL